MKRCDFLIKIEEIFELKDFQDIQLASLEEKLNNELDHIAKIFENDKSIGISYFNLTLVNTFDFKKRYQAYIEKSENEDTKAIVDSKFNEFIKEEILIKRMCWDLFEDDFISGILELALTYYREYFNDDKNVILLNKYVRKSSGAYRAYVEREEQKVSLQDWTQAFFPKENDILPFDNHVKYVNLLSGASKIKIEVQQKDIWKIFLVLMVWAENEKLDLSKYNQMKKATKLNIKIAWFMSENFTIKGMVENNTYFNNNGFRTIKRFSDPTCDTIQLRFIKTMNVICGKIGFKPPSNL